MKKSVYCDMVDLIRTCITTVLVLHKFQFKTPQLSGIIDTTKALSVSVSVSLSLAVSWHSQVSSLKEVEKREKTGLNETK